jgi:hypothetical protein
MERRASADLPAPTLTVFVLDVAASWKVYRELARALDPAPRGLLLQLAGPTEEGIRVVGVWASPADWRRFQTQRLEPLLRCSLHQLPAISLRELRVAHILDVRPISPVAMTSAERSPT